MFRPLPETNPCLRKTPCKRQDLDLMRSISTLASSAKMEFALEFKPSLWLYSPRSWKPRVELCRVSNCVQRSGMERLS